MVPVMDASSAICRVMWWRVAPSAPRSPISGRRSTTLSRVALVMAMAPTSSKRSSAFGHQEHFPHETTLKGWEGTLSTLWRADRPTRSPDEPDNHQRKEAHQRA